MADVGASEAFNNFPVEHLALRHGLPFQPISPKFVKNRACDFSISSLHPMYQAASKQSFACLANNLQNGCAGIVVSPNMFRMAWAV